MNQELIRLINALLLEFEEISDSRKKALELLASLISRRLELTGSAQILFVCTHNSRRSLLAQIWMELASIHFNMESITSYSGGTEATVFNERMVHGLLNTGFQISTKTRSSNPVYQFNPFFDVGKLTDTKYFSKTLDESPNPKSQFIAVMVCDQADESCPVIFGADHKFSLHYKDPKAFDDTESETEAYASKIREIGREILYMVHFMTK